MTYSMTAYARQELQSPWGTLSCEIRSVNHRYLDISLKISDEMRALEGKIREKIGSYIKRGKIDVLLRLQNQQGGEQEFQINKHLVARLNNAIKSIHSINGEFLFPNTLELMKWPGVLEYQELDQDELAKMVLDLLDKSCQDLLQHREREGEQLRQVLLDRLQSVNTVVDELKKHIPQILQGQKDKLLNRLEEFKEQVDQSRLEQELVFMSQKMDVDEELQRLHAHVNEVQQVLQRTEPVGRRLDFLMQELNREANTLASKSVNADSSKAAVELKVLIEQMREQIQNIE